jgi:glycerophosphoryl diester phosphodiesterase
VPTLAEVLDLVGGAAHLDVEIKGSRAERAVLDVLARYPETRWAISSFDWDTLCTVRRMDPGAELWPLAELFDDELPAIASNLGSPAVALFSGAYTPESAYGLRDAGLRVMVWTVNDASEARRVRDLGAFALCSDDPERLMALNGPS